MCRDNVVEYGNAESEAFNNLVSMLFRHGDEVALDWLHLNYPQEYARLWLLKGNLNESPAAG